jgi:hypothetical protein
MSVSRQKRLMRCSIIERWSTGKIALADYLWPVRGNTILNSVNNPGSVATSMLPPCCFTMMSWLIDKPSPVPSPDRLDDANAGTYAATVARLVGAFCAAQGCTGHALPRKLTLACKG